MGRRVLQLVIVSGYLSLIEGCGAGPPSPWRTGLPIGPGEPACVVAADVVFKPVGDSVRCRARVLDLKELLFRSYDEVSNGCMRVVSGGFVDYSCREDR